MTGIGIVGAPIMYDGALRLGTRGSALAMAQSKIVAAAVRAATGRDVILVPIRTHGDIDRSPLTQIGGTGVFVVAVRQAIIDGDVDFAVHSYKDLPTAPEPGIRLAAVPVREDPADVLCAATGLDLQALPVGALIGTGSPRRAAQLLRLRGDLKSVPIRGNVDTRLRAVETGDVAAIVVARAGLARLGRLGAITHTFDVADMVPAPAQGALAVECRADDVALIAALAAIDDAPSRCATDAERALLAGLQAGCAAPVGALAEVAGDTITLTARVISVDGAQVYQRSDSGRAADARDLGAHVAEALLGDGAGEIIEAS
ncbi:MAG: hydroxymethylbilane synthase [Nakamurella sp.]